jgi:hypothetical protein
MVVDSTEASQTTSLFSVCLKSNRTHTSSQAQVSIPIQYLLLACCLQGVQTARHRLMAVFLSIPSGFVKALALRQMQVGAAKP